MKTKTDRSTELINQFAVVLNKFTALEKSSRDFGTGYKLFPSEIHVVEAIGKQPGTNMTDLALVLGISKPAVTQIIGKVIKKNLIKRYNGKGNRKEVLLKLTKSGEIAFQGHLEFHARMDTAIIERFRRLTVREYDFLSKQFADIALYFDQVIKERKP
jgi:DNA-binding MarR family transcriptional regulator